MLNQRETYREPKEIVVRLFVSGNLISSARTLDVTPTGMFVRTGLLLFPKGKTIDVVFDGENHKKPHKVSATVIHRSLKGMGLEFIYQDSVDHLQTQRFLAKEMSCCQSSH